MKARGIKKQHQAVVAADIAAQPIPLAVQNKLDNQASKIVHLEAVARDALSTVEWLEQDRVKLLRELTALSKRPSWRGIRISITVGIVAVLALVGFVSVL